MSSFAAKLARDETGAVATELALVVSMMGVGIIGSVTAVGVKLTNVFVTIASLFP